MRNRNQDDDAASKYIRVGTQYYKKSQQPLAKDTVSVLLKWDKGTIKDDHNNKVLSRIKKYDGFCIIPEHINYKQELGDFYNLYEALPYSPKEGEWPHIKELTKHIFGNQYDLGLDYIQLLYTRPLQILPILAIGSSERNTGKTTFLNLLKWIFEGNMTVNTNDDFKSNFNSHWYSKLIIAVDETLLERKEDSERLKSLSTAKNTKLEKKGVDKVEIEFFGKFILLTNHIDRFVYIDSEEIRYWVVEVKPLNKYDPKFEDKLKREIPAFLHFLINRKMTTTNQHRMWFTPEQIHTKALDALKAFNKTSSEKEIIEAIKHHLLEFELNEVGFTNQDIITLLRERGVGIKASQIKSIVENRWGLEAQNTSYEKYSWSTISNLNDEYMLSIEKVKGRRYLFTRTLLNMDLFAKKEENKNSVENNKSEWVQKEILKN